ncbi:MAG: hypothetical protein KZQ92_22265 [Candidatus Thiodiazotropha sp. (ex Lucinoma borealis)]|nr:hypothetical protein [Candidatus Thiodiazotropha sp. (ex Lucinoma borealis)]MCU7870565.1 hypothetical protein [Candidatus Thiodiazotropha sp. (ex Lucinoma borealis)]
MIAAENHNQGYTYIELLIAAVLAGIVVLGLSGVVGEALQTQDVTHEKNSLARQGNEAMQYMLRAVLQSRRLLLPLNDNPNTNWPEHIREETVPATAPIGDSTRATAVLAVTLPEYVDLDKDGWPDADNDKDGLIDEDLPNDSQHDFSPGIVLIDDDGDGTVDEGAAIADNDEDGTEDEDPIDGIDNDGDGSVDEDPASDANGDGCSGICGVDDDNDGIVDGSGSDDDDEDGALFDDPYDPLVFYLNNGVLMERMPVPWNQDGIDAPDGPVDGRDFITSALAENVTRFRVERMLLTDQRYQVIDLTLELTSTDTGEVFILQSQVRLGGKL